MGLPGARRCRGSGSRLFSGAESAARPVLVQMPVGEYERLRKSLGCRVGWRRHALTDRKRCGAEERTAGLNRLLKRPVSVIEIQKRPSVAEAVIDSKAFMARLNMLVKNSGLPEIGRSGAGLKPFLSI